MDGNSVASVGTCAAPERVDLGEATRVIGMAVRLPILSLSGDPGASGRHGALAGRLLGGYQWPPVLLLLVIALAVARTGLLQVRDHGFPRWRSEAATRPGQCR